MGAIHMIECANCESPQFLQIYESRVYFEDGENINETVEKIECTMCEATGKYVFDRQSGKEETYGSIKQTTERPYGLKAE